MLCPHGSARCQKNTAAPFVDGSAVTAAKCSDQIHLTAEEHAVLGRLIADKLRELL